jgi:general secretion pathway protein A
MYEEFFGFRESPFRVTPDPRFLYHNPCYDEAIAALTYGIEQRKGFISLVGEVGTGKTTLLRHLLDTVAPNVRTVLLIYPTISFEEILEQILAELGIPVEGARKGTMLQRLHEFLLELTAGGGNVALLFDESQALDGKVLEELRLMSNLETGREKIVQLVLAGQPELEEKLRQPEHRQLRQRIALHVRLRPLGRDEVATYIRTRLQHAGSPDVELFTPDATERIAEVTRGIPRIVNVLCDSCCTTAFVTESRRVTRAIVDEAWAD